MMLRLSRETSPSSELRFPSMFDTRQQFLKVSCQRSKAIAQRPGGHRIRVYSRARQCFGVLLAVEFLDGIAFRDAGRSVTGFGHDPVVEQCTSIAGSTSDVHLESAA